MFALFVKILAKNQACTQTTAKMYDHLPYLNVSIERYHRTLVKRKHDHITKIKIKGWKIKIQPDEMYESPEGTCVNRFIESYNPLSRISNSFPRIGQLVLSDCNSFPRIRQSNSWERISHLDITIYLWVFFKSPWPSVLSYGIR